MIKHLVVVGSLNADIVMSVKRLPKDGETITANNIEIFPGGKGANQAVTAARLGYPTYMIGQIGKDENGKMLKNVLIQNGVNTTHIKEIDSPTGTAYIMLQPSGENSIIISSGANRSEWQIGQSEIEIISSAGAVLLQCEIPEHINFLVSKIAYESDVPVIMDAGGSDVKLTSKELSKLYILSPNETELSRLTSMSINTDKEIEMAAKTLFNNGVKEVLIKLGSKGSMLISKRGIERQVAKLVNQVIDTTGAGDSFTAGFVVALLEGKNSKEALNFASTVASICIQKKGAISSLPLREEVDILL